MLTVSVTVNTNGGFSETIFELPDGRAIVTSNVPGCDSFHVDPAPAFVEQLLSEESLRRTGYFRPEAVRHWRQAFRTMRAGSNLRISVEMGLVGVLATLRISPVGNSSASKTV